MTPGFHEDLAFGQKGEQMVMDSYAAHGWTLDHSNHTNTHDFEMVHTEDGRMLRIEVKRDRMAAKTGNLFVEFECRGKDSGIAVSEASVYTFLIGERILSIFTCDLKVLCTTARWVRGGDGGCSKGYLVKVDDVAANVRARDEIRS